MEIRAFSSIMSILLLASILVLAFSTKSVAAAYYYNFDITLTPEYPTVDDWIEVKISFDTSSISDIVTFDEMVSRVGNDFFVDITYYVPEVRYAAIGYAEWWYILDKLPAGTYSFIVTVKITGWGFGEYQHSKSFSVTSPTPLPEFPLGTQAVMGMGVMIVVAYVWLRNRRKTKPTVAKRFARAYINISN
jgi:hypothetical protein